VRQVTDSSKVGLSSLKIFESVKSNWAARCFWFSYFFAGLFLISLFISVTVASISFVLGVLFWFLGRFKTFWPSQLNWWVLALAFTELLLHFLHPLDDRSVLALIKNLLRFYLPWFWLSSLIKGLAGKQVKLLKLSFIGAGSFNGLVVILQSLGFVAQRAIGPSGFASQPYTTSGLTLISTFVTLHYAFRSWRLRKQGPKAFYFYICLLLLQIASLILMSQRAVWLGLMGGCVIWLILNLKKLGWRVPAALTFAGGTFGFFAYLTSQKFRSKIAASLNLLQDKVGFGCRLNVWKANWLSFLKEPITGHGQAVQYECFADKLTHAHNIFLQQLVLNGSVGFIVWMGLLTQIFYNLIKKRRASAYIAGLVAILIEGFFENWWNDSEVISGFWFYLALAFV
jgi:O-antigen ligase